MAENINFIPANELPELEADEVDVLAVDPVTGELGRKPGANLGGSAAIVLTATMTDDGIDVTSLAYKDTGAAPTAQELWDAFRAGAAINIEYTDETYACPSIARVTACSYSPNQMNGVMFACVFFTDIYSIDQLWFLIGGAITV